MQKNHFLAIRNSSNEFIKRTGRWHYLTSSYKLKPKRWGDFNLTNESPIMTVTLKNEKTCQKVDFGKTVNECYFYFEAISSYDEEKPFTSMVELRLLGQNGQVLPVLDWKVVYADSEEILWVSHTTDKIFDNQESTFWHTDWHSNRPGFPHQVIIDLGTTMAIRGMNNLSRTDNSETGNIKNFGVYVKEQPFVLGN